jgi:hypothetical protein
MTIEDTLTRIAVALEALAAKHGAYYAPIAPDTLDRDPNTLELPGVEPLAAAGVQAAAETPKATRTRKPKPDPVVEPEPPVDMTGAEAEAVLHGHLVEPEAAAAPEPVAEAPAAEYKDVQAAATAFSQVGNRDGVLAIFADFGIKTLKDLKPADFQRAIDAFTGATAALQAGAA